MDWNAIAIEAIRFYVSRTKGADIHEKWVAEATDEFLELASELAARLREIAPVVGVDVEKLAAVEAERDRLRGLVETCWQYCGGAKPGPSFDEMHAELYHYMHDIGRVGSAKAALSGDQKGGE